jgi:hypothetical protein
VSAIRSTLGRRATQLTPGWRSISGISV